MTDHAARRALVLAAFCLWLPALLSPGLVVAGTTGTIAGRVLDRQQQSPVVAATILVVGTRFGAYSDAEGNFNILKVPPGNYQVKVSRLGYETYVINEVVVSADNTTRLDVEVGEAAIETEEVVVTAEKPLVELQLTSTKATLSSEEIESLPVQELEDIVNLQAGVVDGHFRGGRENEVQYQVDGVSVNNAYDNSSSLKVDRSILQEVQVISGTFDAEYGQAMSGVVNAVLKEGTEVFDWNAEFLTGGFLFAGNARLTDDTVRPTAIQNYQASFSGPAPLPNTTFLLSGRRYISDDYAYGERRFVPTDSSAISLAIPIPTGDDKKVPLGYSREWSGVAKLTNNSIPNAKLNYSAIFNFIDAQRADFAFRLNPDGMPTQETFAISHGLDWTHTLGKSTFLDLSFRQNYRDYKDWVYENVFDPRYDEAGSVENIDNYELNAIIEGVSFTRFRQKTNAFLAKGSVVSQVTPEHQIKAGGELTLPRVEFGTPGHLTFDTVTLEDGSVAEVLTRHVDEPPDFPGVNVYHPLMAAVFGQDQMEFTDLTVRAGLRFELFDARSSLPSDLANPANSIQGAPESLPRSTTRKFSVSPRLGVAYPIEDKAAIHFSYGHFRQFPAIGTMFNNSDYDVLVNLQASDPFRFGVLGNPDVRPEKTVQYEIGYKHELTDDLGADLTVFFKDIRDLLGVEFIRTYTGAEYPRLTNVDFGNVFGITLALDHRRIGPASIALDYTWQQALGNSSDPQETANRADAGEDPRPRQVPFNWDQRHTLNMTVSINKPESYSLSGVLKVASGQPYTPVLEAGFGTGLVANSGRKPTGTLIDLRAEKTLKGLGADVSLFARVFNLLDARFFNGAVFNSTGSPYYSRFDKPDEVALANPLRFYPPRRIEVGVRMGLGGR